MSKVDEVVKKMLQTAYDTAKEMLNTHRDILERIADYLYEHETITGKEFMDIFNEMMGKKEPVDGEAVEVPKTDFTEPFSEPENREFPENEPIAPDEAFEE